jgi:hypothetical protein
MVQVSVNKTVLSSPFSFTQRAWPKTLLGGLKAVQLRKT